MLNASNVIPVDVFLLGRLELDIFSLCMEYRNNVEITHICHQFLPKLCSRLIAEKGQFCSLCRWPAAVSLFKIRGPPSGVCVTVGRGYNLVGARHMKFDGQLIDPKWRRKATSWG